MSGFVDVFTVACLTAGAFFFLAGTVGLLRFPDALSRLHALTKADNLGLGLIILGLAPRVEGPLDALKLLVVWVLALMGSVCGAQLMARKAQKAQKTQEEP